MDEQRDRFERELEDRLREWTDPAATPQPWNAAARSVIEAAGRGQGAAWLGWRRRLAFAASAAVLVVAVALGVSVLGRPAEVTGSPSAQPSPPTSVPVAPSPVPTVRPTPSIVPAAELDLTQAAWWDLQSIGFGIVPELSPQPSPAVQPAGFKQLRVGTLDGRVTSMLALHWAWGHSYVSLPVNAQVLVANDFGDASTIRAVDARSGSMDELFVTPNIIPAVALVPGTAGDFVYALADRSSGSDRGIWYQLRSGGEPRLVDSAPAGFGIGDVSIWQLAVAPDGRTLLAQYCGGAVSCETHVIDLSTGDRRETTAIGWVQGFLGDRALARPIGQVGLVAMDLTTLQLEEALAFDPGGVGDHPRDSAVELPYGWRADWPELLGDLLEHGPDPVPVRLVNGVTGEELITPELTLTWPGGCTPIRPSELPSGQTPGSSVPTLENGVRMATFGQGDDLVVEATGASPAPEVPDAATPVPIRGVTGEVFEVAGLRLPSGDRLTHPVIQWEEGGCWYRITLTPTTDPAAYASRF